MIAKFIQFILGILFFPLLLWGQKPTLDADSNINIKLNFEPTQLIAPLSLAVSGLYLHFDPNIKYDIVAWRNRNYPNFHTKVDDVLALSPIAACYLLDACSIPARNDFWNRSVMLAKAEMMMLGTVYAIKYISQEPRPDASNSASFPSTHSAQAFLAACLLSTEYRERIPWIPYAAYTVAGSVALLRMANNRHYISDVLVGAAIGILSQKVAYWTHQYRWIKKQKSPFTAF